MNHCSLPINDANSIKAPLPDIERSIIKKYRKKLWIPFIQAINEFSLIEDGDKIGVCISGGKDSLLLAKLLQELRKHGKKNFEIVFLAMDPGFNEINRKTLEDNCKYLNIPVIIKDSQVFEIAQKVAADHPCYLCARMRRGFLYNFAKEQGCNKIALGHHMDDAVETTLLNMLYSGNFKTMMPKLKSTNFEDMELIRPLYYVKETDIINYSKFTGLPFMNCGCTVTAKKTSSKRREMKELVATLKKTFPDVDKSILRSTFNVNLDAIIGFKSRGNDYSFLDFYDDDKVVIDKPNI